MLALVLWYAFGWRVGLAEVFAELAIAALLWGRGGRPANQVRRRRTWFVS